MEYRRMSQDLLEQDIKLHIVTDQEFRFTKTNVSKQFLGEFHDKISWNVDSNNFMELRIGCN